MNVNIDNMIKLRAKYNKSQKATISVYDMIVKAAALASKKVPATMSSWEGKKIR